jgi:hypothetical protein
MPVEIVLDGQPVTVDGGNPIAIDSLHASPIKAVNRAQRRAKAARLRKAKKR